MLRYAINDADDDDADDDGGGGDVGDLFPIIIMYRCPGKMMWNVLLHLSSTDNAYTIYMDKLEECNVDPSRPGSCFVFVR